MLARWYLSLRHRCWAIDLTKHRARREVSECRDSGGVAENYPRHKDKEKGRLLL